MKIIGGLLTHNSALSLNVGLSMGEGETKIIKKEFDKLYLNLEPFLKLTEVVVKNF